MTRDWARFPTQLRVFTTVPGFSVFDVDFGEVVASACQAAEELSCEGGLLYTNRKQVEVWTTAQFVIARSERFRPLIAVQPAYMHPFTVAKKVTALALLYRRGVNLNFIAGTNPSDLVTLGDGTPHDERYERLREHAQIVRLLLESATPISYSGRHYRLEEAVMEPSCPPDLLPGIFFAGNSDQAREVSDTCGGTLIEHLLPPWEYVAAGRFPGAVHFGVITRPDSEEAWSVARALFPTTEADRTRHRRKMGENDTVWRAQLEEASRRAEGAYWLEPFVNQLQPFAYLVGSYEEIGAELAPLVAGGCRTIVLNRIWERDELQHVARAFHAAVDRAEAEAVGSA
jgi:alkanesulfonate monooxygenase